MDETRMQTLSSLKGLLCAGASQLNTNLAPRGMTRQASLSPRELGLRNGRGPRARCAAGISKLWSG